MPLTATNSALTFIILGMVLVLVALLASRRGRLWRNVCFALVLSSPALLSHRAVAQTSLFSASQAFTAAGQTGVAIALAGNPQAGLIGGYSSGLITITGVGLTTATIAIQGSADGGTTWFPLNTAVYSTPATQALTQTVTGSALLAVNLGALTNVRFVTSGTFTATSISVTLSATALRGLL